MEETILQLEQKITTEQDTVQINAPDFDLDIDRPNPPRTCNNTAVVSVQENLTSPKPEVSDATNFQEEDTETHLMPYTTILGSPMGMTISPRRFKIIQQNRTKSLQDTALIQKKYLN